MSYDHTFESREAAREAGRLCCCVCLLDLGPADDPYRDPSCPRCAASEFEEDDSSPEDAALDDDRDQENPVESADYGEHPEWFDNDPDWR